MKSIFERKAMIDRNHSTLSINKQVKLLSIPKSSYYYTPVPECKENLTIMNLMDKQYHETPFYGALRLREWLKDKGYDLNIKRVRRLMKLAHWQTIYREPKTTISDPTSYKYPYLLKNMEITHVNQVWAMDITYIPMHKGFLYLTAIIDLYSRYIIHWSLSSTMTAEWCQQTVQEAIDKHGKPEIFNTDQGSQFTSDIFINTLKVNNIKISMDGKGRALDNIYIERFWRTIKYEHVYLHVYENGRQLWNGLSKYFEFYNTKRYHQSLDYKTPRYIYKQTA